MEAILVFIFLCVAAYFQIRRWVNRHHTDNAGFLWGLFFFHFLLMGIYLSYAFATVSDSFEYFRVAKSTEDWGSLWGTGTSFINFITWPLAQLGFSYASITFLYSYLGFLGVGMFYFAAREQVGFLPPVWERFTWAELIWLLPNIHFWSSSLGKGSVALFAVALYVYGLSRYNKRILFIAAGIFIAYMLRPHLAFIMALGTAIGILFTNRGVPWYIRAGIVILGGIGSVFFFQGAQELISVKEGSAQMLAEFIDKRAKGLTEAKSGIDIENYNTIMKAFTFLYRPLFFDANGVLGIIVSIENAFYLYMAWVILKVGLPRFGKWNGWFKAGLFVFLMGTYALSQISGNLGLAMRQKAQLMPLYFLLFLKMKEWEFESENPLLNMLRKPGWQKILAARTRS